MNREPDANELWNAPPPRRCGRRTSCLLPSSALACPNADEGTTHSYLLVAEADARATLRPNAPIVLEAAECIEDDGVSVLCADGSVAYRTTTRRGTTRPWWTDARARIDRGERPVIVPASR